MKSLFWHYPRKWGLSLFRYLSAKKYWLLILTGAYCIADLVVISLHPIFLLDKVPRPILNRSLRQKTNNGVASQYMPIWDLNIFHNEAIPIEDTVNNDETPQKSRLPLQLNGVIVSRNPNHSIASITLKDQNLSGAYRVGEQIEKKDTISKTSKILARVTKISPARVYFINRMNQKTEYIDLQKTKTRQITFDSKKASNKKKKKNTNNNFLKKIGDFQFQVNRSDVNKYLRDLDSILRDAKVVPHRENGQLIGWRFQYIKKGSLFEKFGFQESDILTSVAGELPKSQLHAAELFHRFSSSLSKIDIMINRKGKDIPFSWNVHEDHAKEKPPASRYIY